MAINISTSEGVFAWRPAAWLQVSGTDAANFLQGQFTNDLRELEKKAAVYGLWLDVKGKVQADSFVLREPAENRFWIGSYFSPAALIRERLESHVIADDVVIADQTSEWAAFSVVGEAAARLSRESAAQGFVFPGRRARERSMEWVFPVSAVGQARDRLGDSRELTGDDLQRLRIEAGIPAIPMELGPGDLPPEGGIEEAALSYTKGCYLGQEVMARLKSMGQVRRRLMRVAARGAVTPTLPAPLFLGARKVGELRTAVADAAGGAIGFAMLSLVYVQPGAELALAPDVAATWRVLDIP